MSGQLLRGTTGHPPLTIGHVTLYVGRNGRYVGGSIAPSEDLREVIAGRMTSAEYVRRLKQRVVDQRRAWALMGTRAVDDRGIMCRDTQMGRHRDSGPPPSPGGQS